MNIDAVARRAGVSPATVSRTLNGTARVKPETAARVRDAVKALHFLPNTNARSLGSGRSHLYGLIISDIANPFFPELVKAFEALALKHGREVLIVNTDYELKRMNAGVMRLLQRRVDGVAIMTSEIDPRSLEVLTERKVPTVFFDAGKLAKPVNVVRVDYTSGIFAAMRHLHVLGHRDVAFISGRRSLASAEVRLRAFRKAAAELEFRVLPEWPDLALKNA
jgi:DNA-binding LacI/PurR family transcriptional regulator